METTIAQKLEDLINLQNIDSQIDQLTQIRGDLPEEVRDLEDEIEGYETRISKFTAEGDAYQAEVDAHRNSIKEAEKHIRKYEEQQMNVRNSREYEAISKEIEAQQLDIQIFEKKIGELQLRIHKKKDDIEGIQGVLEERRKDLITKKEELSHIVEESKEDEAQLVANRNVAVSKIEERLLFSYNRLRKNSRNGLAVAAVKRSACGGCFNQVPPQRQAEIRERKKIIVCEHCGRILASVESGELEAAQAIAAAKAGPLVAAKA
jgi:predicted  nucleic acid-binding Zn-ribbon protein